MARFKKRLGQNFLIDKEVLKDIIKISEIKKDESILEIGAGSGVLTKELLKKGAKVTAVEIDYNLVRILKKNFSRDSNLKIIEADILRILNPKFLILDSRYKLIGNIPYQITSPLLRKIFKLDNPPELIILMVQKEVAERICAKPGDSKRGFLSVVVQYYSQPEIIKIVPRESFYPVPKVESAIIKIRIKNQELRIKEDQFFRLVQAGFSQKRKKLRNSLSAGLRIEPKKIDEFLQKIKIDSNLRAEDLSIKQWEKVSSML